MQARWCRNFNTVITQGYHMFWELISAHQKHFIGLVYAND